MSLRIGPQPYGSLQKCPFSTKWSKLDASVNNVVQFIVMNWLLFHLVLTTKDDVSARIHAPRFDCFWTNHIVHYGSVTVESFNFSVILIITLIHLIILTLNHTITTIFLRFSILTHTEIYAHTLKKLSISCSPSSSLYLPHILILK